MVETVRRRRSRGRRLAVLVLAAGAGLASKWFDVWPATYLPGSWMWLLIFATAAAVDFGRKARRAATAPKRVGLIAGLAAVLWLWGCTLLGMTGWDARFAQAPSTDVMRWEKEAAHRISRVDRYNARELEFLRPLLSGRRIVLLGESSHRVEEYSKVKCHIIRFLHEELGFNVLAFENYALSTYLANLDLAAGARAENVVDCLYPMWRTTTVRRLFSYVASTRTTQKPLQVVGFDLKLKWDAWPKAMGFLVGAIEGDTFLVRDYHHAQEHFGPDIYDRIKRGEIDANNPLGKEFVAFYVELAGKIEQRRVRDPEAAESRDALFAAQLARNIAVLPRYYRARRFNRVAIRDSVMAGNVIHLAERQFPNQKIIIWAQNIHISRSHSTARLSDMVTLPFEWVTNRLDRVRRMGEYLSRRYGDEMYTVGLLMASGSYETNEGKRRWVRPPRRDSVEDLLHDPSAAAVYLDLTSTDDSAGRSWQSAPSSVLMGSYWYTLVPANQYDGLLVISNAHPPKD
jgi:erythromycin esterase